jgi:hypothetical protein
MLLVLLCPDEPHSGTVWLLVVLCLLTNVGVVAIGCIVECYSAHRRSDYEWPARMVRDDRYAKFFVELLFGILEGILYGAIDLIFSSI